MADSERIEARLRALWEIARGPGGGADRPAYSSAEAQALRLVAGWAAELGLEPGIDPHGNLWALPPGDGSCVSAGSHVDTVPDGGRYDGALGTVLGLEIVADLAGRADAPPAGLLVCAAEEAPRFGAGTIGSRRLAGTLPVAELAELHDRDGISAADALAAHLDALADLPRLDPPPLSRLAAHAEVHVALRFGGPELGVVARVAAPRRFAVRVDGEAGHAGEVAMGERRDALPAAAEIVLAVERAARAQPPPAVATVGTLELSPGAVSVIPGRARLGIDLRATDPDVLEHLEQAVRRAVAEVGRRRAVDTEVVRVRGGDPTEMDPALRAGALRAARTLGVPVVETWSGAGHDAQHVQAHVPALLVFVPLHDGPSHTPGEGARMAEILAAARIVSETLCRPVPEM